eukprot:12960998-Alexandrium_andersonii.AAC.1
MPREARRLPGCVDARPGPSRQVQASPVQLESAQGPSSPRLTSSRARPGRCQADARLGEAD